MKSHLTDCGIPGVGVVPYGIHMCHFYPARAELVDGLIPYFAAGLERDERCLWIASPPVSAIEIAAEIPRYPEMERAFRSGQLKILDGTEWHGDLATVVADESLKRWIAEEEAAIADGYQGLRVANNMHFRPGVDWTYLLAYETSLHERLRGRRVVVCCSYDRGLCGPVDMLDVVRRHDAALDRHDDHWQVFVQKTHRGRSQNGKEKQHQSELRAE
ncbi:MAG TPA: MEDS domain-containing protein [Rhizomicrobium sp.]